MTEEDFKKKLTPDQYYVLREKGTERPFTGKYNTHYEKGVYSCAACGQALYKSEDKFDSGCGWPSFDDEIEGAIERKRDVSHGMIRTEILCSNCGSHLGHVFNDGPTHTGIRHCVNSLSLDFEKK
jgi:peptide-methionine (R)-S-oxide reductase